MTDKYKDRIAGLLQGITAALGGGASAELIAFTEQYYIKMPLMDLEKLDPARAAKVAAWSYQFIKERTAVGPKIRFFTPEKDKEGFEAGALVLEIVNDDMPFLVDSVTAELNRLGCVITDIIHPIIRVKRGSDGRLEAVAENTAVSQGWSTESLMHFEIASLPPSLTQEQLTADILNVLNAVRLAVADWKSILAKVDAQTDHIAQVPKLFKQDELDEVRDFMRWLKQKNFVFLGYVEYDFYDENRQENLSVVKGSELGIFKLGDHVFKPQGLHGLPPEVLHFLLVPQLLEITKSTRNSVVHRAVPMDYIGIKRFDAEGNVIGECRFLGLFTSIVYYQSAGNIPIIRRKISRVQARANFDPVSYDGKTLKAILEFAPRDELFQMTEDDVFEYAIGVLSLEARPKVRLFMRRDAFQRFLSCIVFVPRDRFSTALREQIQTIVERASGGQVTDFYTQMTNSPLARVHLIVRTKPGQIKDFKVDEVEAAITSATNLWGDSLREALIAAHGEARGDALMRRFGRAFSRSYVTYYDAAAAVHDIDKIQKTADTGRTHLELFRGRHEDARMLHLKLFSPATQVPLSDVLPMLENLGFKVIDEMPFLVNQVGGDDPDVWIRDFTLSTDFTETVDIAAVKPKLEEALSKIWAREVENDGYNTLVMKAALSWRDVVLLRAYGKYIKQTGAALGQDTIIQALSAYPAIARKLVALFDARFSPEAKGGNEQVKGLLVEIDHLLADVTNLAHDRTFRRYCDLIQATLRTNYFQVDEHEAPKPYVSFKIDSARVPELPKPHPYAEIFVYSQRFEGIHLRGGKVARGGLRWSDRPDDFRTEVLGLMKAQMVKNTVIVPVGSKGGFVLKAAPPPSQRDAWMQEGIACYQNFLRGLLDVTDNIIGGAIISPQNVVRHDGDDPYLVVAADKGTASFSDYANQVSAEYGFWLNDAFASGGQNGYDHKKMAITARGGFISVERHFRETGIDIHAQDFTVAGIGDMSGDVFGNGMLLSKHIKLVAAFDHRHIFIDPSPDIKKSFAERERIFALPRSSWADYGRDLISKGGGIYERTAKTITLGKEAMQALGTDKSIFTPDDLIKTILLAPVDLLWNGGIGTYVKAEDETHEQVGDRTNNAVRVNGRELRCKVVGEGGNLGFTQKGRIEYARNGGRINTDAIDNSAGVDCSDHEVNIKIALGAAQAAGKLDAKARNALLAKMTEEVAQLVLKDNRLQTRAITFAEQQSLAQLDALQRMMQQFERMKELDRAIEFLPTDKQLQERRAEKRGLTRPEIAVLLSYSKMVLYKQLLESDLPDDAYFHNYLLRYFPEAMQKNYAEIIAAHPLKREIIATVVTNSIINRSGLAFIHTLAEDSGMKLSEVAKAYMLARDAFALRPVWSEIEALETALPVAVQAELFAQSTYFLSRVTQWFLRHVTQPIRIEASMDRFTPGIAEYIAHYPIMLSPSVEKSYREKLERFAAPGVPATLVEKIARFEILASACDVVSVAERQNLSIPVAGKVYFDLGTRLKLGWLRRTASHMHADSYWDRLAAQSVIHQLLELQSRITAQITQGGCTEEGCVQAVDAWCALREADISRLLQFVEELRSKETIDFPRLIIAIRHIEALA